MIRVLVADRSPVSRALLVSILHGDREVEVVGEAKNAREAIELTRRLRPDVVTMEGAGGFEATKEIMVECPTPIVVLTDGGDAEAVGVSMEALRTGAVCVLHKPSVGLGSGNGRDARQLVETVKAMSQVKVVRHVRRAVRPAPPGAGEVAAAPVRLIAMAASTGGPAALQQVLMQLPGDFRVPIVVVQHMGLGFMAGLAEWLDGACALRVKLAEDGEPLRAATVYLGPDGWHLGVSSRAAIVLAADPPIQRFRPSATHLFDSVASAFGAAAAAVVLTGMGEDGVEGLRVLRAAGGRVLVQDQATSVIYGMPGAAVAAGLASRVLPLGELARALIELATGGGR